MIFRKFRKIVPLAVLLLFIDASVAQRIKFGGGDEIQKLDELNEISLRFSTAADGLALSSEGILFKISQSFYIIILSIF